MKDILVVGTISDDVRQLILELCDTYDFTEEPDISKGFIHLLENTGKYGVVLVDHPSQQSDDLGVMIDYLTENSLGEDALPILIITDDRYAEEDLPFLGGAVIDCLERPFSIPIVKNRIERSAKWMNSVSFAEFAQMLKALPANVYLKDRYGRYVFSSQTWHHLDTGGDPNWSIVGKTDMDVRKDKDNARKALESDLRLIETGVGSDYIIREGDDANPEYLQIIKEPLFQKNGKTVRGIIALINDVTEQELMRRRLHKLAVTDNLTGLYNKGYGKELLEDIWGFADVNDTSFALIYADMNHFKPVNDTFGHEAGDYVLHEIGERLQSLPERFTVIRIGGDEFLILLTEFENREDVQMAAKEIQEVFSKPVTWEDNTFDDLSASLGISIYPDDGTDVGLLVRYADAAMYDVKRSENRKDIRFFKPEMMEGMEGVRREFE